MNRDKELLIMDTALTCLLDNFMYQPDDFADLDITEAEIKDMIVKLFNEQQRRRVNA
jgi:hypothetical protein